MFFRPPAAWAIRTVGGENHGKTVLYSERDKPDDVVVFLIPVQHRNYYSPRTGNVPIATASLDQQERYQLTEFFLVTPDGFAWRYVYLHESIDKQKWLETNGYTIVTDECPTTT